MNTAVYTNQGSKRVKGWLARESMQLAIVVAFEQETSGVHGAAAEIGIYHGKHFILLYLLLREDERALAIDLFEDQHLNVDNSGVGDRTSFEANLRAAEADVSRIDVISGSSLEVVPEDITSKVGPVRLFSVDGGHTTTIALNDLRLAEAALADGGVVILDDVFQSLFPGVSAALAEFLPTSGLVPFAVSPEKVLLTQPAHHDRMLGAVRDGLGNLFLRIEDFYGSEVAIVRGTPSNIERLQLGVAQWDGYKWLRSAPGIGTVVERARPTVLRLLRR